MKTAKEKVLDMLRAGDNVGAMRVASRWHDLGEHKEPITRGWASRTNAEFYRQIGEDPDVLWDIGVSALKERLGSG